MTAAAASPAFGGLRGRYAGVVTRFGAFLVDVLAIGILFVVGSTVVEYVVTVLTGDEFDMSDRPTISAIAMAAWAFAYSAYLLSAAGHTLGMAMAGVRVVRRDGHQLDGWHAVLRVLLFPLSFAVFGLGFLLILIRRDRRALHDLLADTAVVYAWDAHTARPRFLDRPPLDPHATPASFDTPTRSSPLDVGDRTKGGSPGDDIGPLDVGSG
jgi:uncharacterized RDD family membrane protein YckC